MLRHRLEMLRHNIHCVVTVFYSLLFIFCCDRNFCLRLFNFIAPFFAMLRHSFFCYSQSLLLAEMFVATLKSLSGQSLSIFYSDIIFFCHKKNLLLCSFYCDDNIFIIETKLYCHCLIIVATEISAFSF